MSSINHSQHPVEEKEQVSNERGKKASPRSRTRSSKPVGEPDAPIPSVDQTSSDETRLEGSLRALRFADSPRDRAAAARNLGVIGSGFATANLVAALFDSDGEVRAAAAQALDQIGDPSVAAAPMRALVANEPDTPAALAPAEDSTPAQIEIAELDAKPAPTQTTVSEGSIVTVDSGEHTGDIDVQHLTEQESAARDAVGDLERQLVGIEVSRASAESEVRLSAEREARLQASVTALAGEEKELRERADEIAERRLEVGGQLRLVQTARSESERKIENLRTESERIRQEAEQLRLLAEQYSREILRAEATQKQAAFAAERAEARHALQETEALHRSAVERLQSEEEGLRQALEQLAMSRVEVDAARQEAEKQSLQLQEKRAELAFAEAKRREEIQRAIRAAEAREQKEREELRKSEESLRETVEQIELRRAQIEFALQEARDSATRLSEVQARIQAAEDARRQDEAEYARLEAESSQQAQEATRRLEALRLRFQEEQQRLEEQGAQTAAEEERRLGELDTFRKALEAEARRRAAKEKTIQVEIQQLLHAEVSQREKIERAESELRELEAQHRAAEEEARLQLAHHEREYELRRQANAEARLKVEEEMRRRIAEEQQLKHEAEETIRQLKNDARREAEKRVQRIAQLEALRQQLATAAATEVAREEHLKQEIEDLQKEEQKLRLRIQSQARLRATVEERVQQEKERFERETANLQDAQQRMRSLPDVDAASHGTHRVPDLPTRAESLAPDVLPGLQSPDPAERAASVATMVASGGGEAFRLIVEFFDDPAPEVRNAAAIALSELDAPRSVESFTRAIESALPERRRKIGAAIAGSGLAAMAIERLGSDNREDNYNALSLLFTMAKAGELQPLVEAIERHAEVQVRRAAIRLLNLVGQSEVANAAAKRRLSLFSE